MHARYFSPNLGRFLSVDPVGGEVGSSQSWNRYTYVLNNPIGTVDPDGREVRPVVVIGTGGKPVLTYVDVRMVPRLNALNLDAHRAGVSFTYNNVFRTREQQDAIVTPNTRNTTGTSPHLAGLAVDIGNSIVVVKLNRVKAQPPVLL